MEENEMQLHFKDAIERLNQVKNVTVGLNYMKGAKIVTSFRFNVDRQK
jgi:hypothetical protein